MGVGVEGWSRGRVPGLGHSTSYFRVFSVDNVVSKLSGNRVYDGRHFIVHFLERLHGMLPGDQQLTAISAHTFPHNVCLICSIELGQLIIVTEVICIFSAWLINTIFVMVN